jgi:5'-nucleotidase
MKTIIFLDMDGVLADFDGAITSGIVPDPPEMFEPGFFRNLKPMPGSKESVAKILANPEFEVYIGSKMTSKVTTCATEKMEWIKEHFPALLRHMVLVCDKKLLRGDILIDDDHERWESSFRGLFIRFDRTKPKKSWKTALSILSRYDREKA